LVLIRISPLKHGTEKSRTKVLIHQYIPFSLSFNFTLFGLGNARSQGLACEATSLALDRLGLICTTLLRSQARRGVVEKTSKMGSF
jgi:hypothetical protein